MKYIIQEGLNGNLQIYDEKMKWIGEAESDICDENRRLTDEVTDAYCEINRLRDLINELSRSQEQGLMK